MYMTEAAGKSVIATNRELVPTGKGLRVVNGVSEGQGTAPEAVEGPRSRNGAD